jgi:hypothetical protein
MSLSVTSLIESAETRGEALRLFRVARDWTQADIVARSAGTIGGEGSGAEPCRRSAAYAAGPR